MNKRTNSPDPHDKGYAPTKPVGDTPLPDARSAENEAMEPIADPASQIPTGTQNGQTTRGSYGTDPATGAGAYMDHTGTFSNKPVAQPGTDQDEEPDAVDPTI